MREYKYNFRGALLSRTKVKNNILRVLAQVDKETFDRGLNWYSDAYNFASEVANESGYTVNQIIGVIAALSPLKSWALNKRLAREFAVDGVRGGHTKMCVNKADAILNMINPSDDEIVEELSGQKIVNFFLNIAYPNKDVAITIDRHAVGIALMGTKRIKAENSELAPTKKQFEFLVHCYKWASAELDISAVQLQAITWEHFRKLKIKY